MRSSLDQAFEEEGAYIKQHYNAARANLNKLGWQVLSEDTRLAFFSFKIQKGEHIHRVSLREALLMK